VGEWSLTLTAEHHLAPSTIRAYQCSLRQFNEYLCDSRYGWVTACRQEFGPQTHPVLIVHEWNTIPHLNDYEGDPEARPFTREELQRFLDYADEQVDRAARAKPKGALAAYRDATLFKVLYGWGLRRTEAAKLDVVDFGRNPAAPAFGRFGMLNVRYGKAKRGQPPRLRNVASVMGWAVEAVAEYIENVRPAARLHRTSGIVGNRTQRPDQTGGDQRPVRRLPERARPIEGADAAFDATFLRLASHRGWCRPSVHPMSGWPRGR
jgi:integrase